MQKTIISLSIVIFSISTSFAQFGINGGYHFNDAEKWKIVNGDNTNDVIHDFYENNIGCLLEQGVRYWTGGVWKADKVFLQCLGLFARFKWLLIAT